jgi:hypothetical protein
MPTTMSKPCPSPACLRDAGHPGLCVTGKDLASLPPALAGLADLVTVPTQAPYLARASELHMEDCPEANQALDNLAMALAGMEEAGLHDDTHLLNMVAHLLGWQAMPF